MTLRGIVGTLTLSLALSAGIVAATQSTARACGGYTMSPEERDRALVGNQAWSHVMAVFPQAREVRLESVEVSGAAARVRVLFSLPGVVGTRVRTLDLARSADGAWTVTSARRGRMMARLANHVSE